MSANHNHASVEKLLSQSINQSEFTKTVFYINHYRCPVWVVTPANERIFVDVTSNLSSDDFIVRTFYKFSLEAFKRLHDYFNAIKGKEPIESMVFFEAFTKAYEDQFEKPHYLNQYTVVVEYLVPFDRFSQSKTINVPSLNFYMSIEEDIVNVPFHYDSLSGRCEFDKVSLLEKTSGQYFSIRLIDNVGNHGPRYFLFAGHLYVIHPSRDDRCDNGVYVRWLTRTYGEDDESQLKVYTVQDAEEVLGLYKTREEALAAGDIQLARSERIRTLEHDTEVLKRENQSLALGIQNDRSEIENERLAIKLRHEEEMLQLDKKHREQNELFKQGASEREMKLKDEVQRVEIEYRKTINDFELKSKEEKEKLEAFFREEKSSIERMSLDYKEKHERRRYDMDHYYTGRSLDRKDTSEIVKFLPGLALGALAIGVAVMKK